MSVGSIGPVLVIQILAVSVLCKTKKDFFYLASLQQQGRQVLPHETFVRAVTGATRQLAKTMTGRFFFAIS